MVNAIRLQHVGLLEENAKTGIISTVFMLSPFLLFTRFVDDRRRGSKIWRIALGILFYSVAKPTSIFWSASANIRRALFGPTAKDRLLFI